MTCSETKNHNLNRKIIIPFCQDKYEENLNNPKKYRIELDKYIKLFPELFPQEINKGYELKDIYHSKKISIGTRRILVDGISYTIRPSFVMPFNTGFVSDIEHALFLRKFDVPYWALTHVFGKNHMYWYRIEQALGRNSIVGTTIKHAENLPEHLVADEKHTRVLGKKAYIATTAGNGCILGAAISESANETGLTKAYGKFKDEIKCVHPEYQPSTVNTDGWQATINTWQVIFPTIVIICCFLHVFIKIRDRGRKKYKEIFNEVASKFWDCYEASTKRSFCQRVRRLYEWGEKTNIPSVMLKPIQKMRENINRYSIAYDFMGAHRTSNLIDRLMQRMDRHIFNIQYFHGKIDSAELNIRGWALIHNFAPSNPFTVKKYNGMKSPAERINKFSYHENWLQNLLISTSLGGYRAAPQKAL